MEALFRRRTILRPVLQGAVHGSLVPQAVPLKILPDNGNACAVVGKRLNAHLWSARQRTN
eukprot:1985510-Alexandrium_andersonii.AAC.1